MATGPTPDPRIPDAFSTAEEGDSPAAVRLQDPLRLCVATTVALIAWIVTPPVAVVVFASLAIVGYGRGRRAGLLQSRCILGDTRRVLAYLTVALAAGVIGVLVRLT